MAQMTDTNAPQAEGEDAIIVTARRQNERLQDVPASVAVITADTLARTGAVKAEEFVKLTQVSTYHRGKQGRTLSDFVQPRYISPISVHEVPV
jgi:outer membrane cobalamin receptor